jgi:hypothetical protein
MWSKPFETQSMVSSGMPRALKDSSSSSGSLTLQLERQSAPGRVEAAEAMSSAGSSPSEKTCAVTRPKIFLAW